MATDVVVPLAAAIGSAVAAGMSGFRIAKWRLAAQERTAYVRLSAEDSDRVEKITALLERLVGLEEQTQSAIERLGEQLVAARLEQAQRHGELTARLSVLGG